MPWLPAGLRTAWASQPLPDWVRDLGGLPVGAKCGDFVLIPSVDEAARERLTNFATYMLRKRIEDVGKIPAVGKEIDPRIDLARLPYKTRTRNILAAEGLLQDLHYAATITYQELLGIPGMGVMSALDFACTTEGAMRQYELLKAEAGHHATEEKLRFERALADLADVASAPWADQISDRDARFAALMPAGRGSLLDRVEQLIAAGDPREIEELAEKVPAIREQIRQISSLPIEEALEEMVGAAYRLDQDRRAAFMKRFGWSGDPPATLQEVGDQLGITRERVRQIESQILKRLPPRPIFLPSLEQAIRLLEAASPISLKDAANLIQVEGKSKCLFHPKGVINAAEICGLDTSLRIRTIKGAPVVLGNWEEGLAGRLANFALRQCGASGVSNIAAVVEHATSEGLNVSEDEAARLLRTIPRLVFLTDSWFWDPKGPPGRNRLRNTCRKMLSVSTSIPLSRLREGIRREFAFRTSSHQSRWQLRVPPVDVLRTFLRAHPDFIVDESGCARSTSPLDYKVELGDVYATVVEVLRASPAGVLDRQSIRDACIARGVNPSSLEMALTYSPVVEHLDTNIWGLRGIDVSPAAVEALRVANAMKPREKRIHGFGWTPEGKIWVAARLPGNVSAPVLGIPSGVKRYLVGQRFRAVAQDGSDQGNVAVTEDGSAYGFGRYLDRAGADEGDFLALEFDLPTKEVLLRLGGEELLDALES